MPNYKRVGQEKMTGFSLALAAFTITRRREMQEKLSRQGQLRYGDLRATFLRKQFLKVLTTQRSLVNVGLTRSKEYCFARFSSPICDFRLGSNLSRVFEVKAVEWQGRF